MKSINALATSAKKKIRDLRTDAMEWTKKFRSSDDAQRMAKEITKLTQKFNDQTEQIQKAKIKELD